MVAVQITASADADLAGRAGWMIAERYAAAFDALFERLADHPAMGAPRLELGLHTRIGIVQPYLAIYEYREDKVTILRVLHGRRNITARLIRGQRTEE
jgi:toxin ParE1/3/4